jgi:hypothetical protein
MYIGKFSPRRKERFNYDFNAANGITIHTYGWLSLSLNLGLRRDFTWRSWWPTSRTPSSSSTSHISASLWTPNTTAYWTGSLSVPAQATSSLIPNMKTISGGTPVYGLLAEFPDFTHPARVQREVRHNTVQHIQTIPGPPVTCRPRRLAPFHLAIA